MAGPLDPFALVGQVVEGQYRIDAVVGEGGFGVVYKGWHIAFEQPIAVKALKVLDVADAEARISVLGRFREEAKLCYVLSQASLAIVRCIGYGAVVTPTQAWAPYLVLEWLEGRPLSEELVERRRRGDPRRTISEAMRLLTPIAEGLTYAHSQRVAHRDVKPGNLFLVGEGGRNPTLKILDFGVAKVIQEGETAATALTKGGLAAFTPYYAAPEQLDPRFGPTGPWTDVYGFALVMGEVLSGKQPVDGPDVISVVAQVLNPNQRPTPRALGALVPDGVESAFARALTLDPKARFPDMASFWEALAGAARLMTSWRPSEGSIPPNWVAPSRTAPMASVGGAISPAAATPSPDERSATRSPPRAPAPSIPTSPATNEGPAATSTGRRSRYKAVVGLLFVCAVLVVAGAWAIVEYAQ